MIEGVEKVDNEYVALQTEIDKLLWETSKNKTHKKYQKMSSSKQYKTAMKKIGKLVLRLEKIEEDTRKKKRKKINT